MEIGSSSDHISPDHEREREGEREEIFTFSSLDIEYYFSIFVPCLGLKPIDQSEIGLITLVRSLGC